MSLSAIRLKLWSNLAQASFILFILLTFLTPSWRDGPFRWWPLWHAPLLAGAPVTLGLFNLLPLLILGGWFIHRLYNRWQLPAWQWGWRGIALPMGGLTILGLLSLQPELTRRTFTQAGSLALFWFVYLFIINERPSLTFPFLLITFFQGTVAIAQFALQKDLGLVALGELPLNPAFEGITVLYAREQPWLRAYGLTAHPNLLGAILTMLLLWLLPQSGRWQGWRQAVMLFVVSIGLLALFVSFSRSAWLALGLGLLVWYVWGRRLPAPEVQSAEKRPFPLKRLLPVLPLLFLLIFNYDLALSRFLALSSPIELTSLHERLTDGRLALQIIARQPWRGVGLGNYADTAQNLEPTARRVHNVPLYVTAELGVLATLLWFWLMLSPNIQGHKQKSRADLRHQLPAWTAMLVMNMFDTMVWWSSNWQTAVLFALLAAQTSQSLTSASHHDYGSPESPPA